MIRLLPVKICRPGKGSGAILLWTGQDGYRVADKRKAQKGKEENGQGTSSKLWKATVWYNT